MRCPNCATENRPGVRFCEECGEPLDGVPAENTPSEPGGQVCPACGYANRPEVRFCEECGQALMEVMPEAMPEPEAVPVGELACPSCGYANRAGIQFCEECGHSLIELVPAPAEVICPACGHRNRPEIRFCEECGASLVREPFVVRWLKGIRPLFRRWWSEAEALPLGPLRLGTVARRWLTAGVAVILVAAVVVISRMPEISQREALNATHERLESLNLDVADIEPVLRTNCSEGTTTYTLEYQTDSGKIIFIVDAETGETLMMGTR